MSETKLDTQNQMAEMALALQQFQTAMDAMKKAGLLTGDLKLPIITATQKPALLKAAMQVDAAMKADVVRVEVRAKAKAKAKPKKKVIAPETVDAFITWFCTASIDDLYNVKRSQWECQLGTEKDRLAAKLVFHSKVKNDRVAGKIICLRPKDSDLVLFNASRITYGQSDWRDQKHPQAVAELAGAIPIPFEVIKAGGEAGAGLDLDKLEIMQHNDAEQLLIPPVEKLEWGNEVEVCQRHFAGATLVRINKDCFLFDCDREELKRFGFNPFFTRLPAFVKTVDEAYEELMPDEVKKAIKDGKAVQRQGEFFFVPADNEKVRKFSLSKQHTSDSHIFTYCDVLAKILELGMAQFQGLRKRAYDGVKKYLAYCQRVYGGKIPLVTEKASEHDAAETLKPYMDSLLAKPALEINWNEISSRFERLERRRADFRKKAKKLKEENPVDEDGEFEMDSDYEALDVELGNLLTDGNNQRWQYGDSAGPLSHWNIKMNNALGVTDDDGNTRGRHTCTAVVEVGPQEVYAIGVVQHGGREHRPIWLGQFHRVYSNTATSNWTVSGNVD